MAIVNLDRLIHNLTAEGRDYYSHPTLRSGYEAAVRNVWFALREGALFEHDEETGELVEVPTCTLNWFPWTTERPREAQ